MRPRNPRTLRDMTILGGWLFADLLLGLMVIFLAAQPAFPKTLPITPTPTLGVTPTPTPEPRLEFSYHHFQMDNVDYNGILSNNPAAVGAVEQFINSQGVLRNRSAGLVVVYDGAPNDNDIADAQTIGKAIINNVLKAMGRRGALFQRASYYGPIFYLNVSHSTIFLDIYLFQQ